MGIIACLLNFILSFQISSNFKNFSILFIAFFGFIVLNIEVLSLFKMINGENILILTLIEFLIVHLYWLKKKKPVYLPNFKGFLVDLKKAFVEDKSLIVLSISLIFMVIASFLLCIISPPNEADASSYHCLRSLFWLKDGFISHFEVSDIRCHSMPINSELFYVWILALFKKDTLFGLLQFCSYFLLLFSSFNIMEFYNIEFKKRIWALIIFSSFAGVISQISSTQTDLCVGALLSCSIYLIHCYIKDKRLSLLFFSSLCMGLSFGVKSTGVIGSIPLIIWYIVLLRKDFIKYFIFLCFNFIVFSSYNYILNFINYGNFLGAKTILAEHSIYYSNFKEYIIAIFSNLIRYFYSIFDFSGLMIFYLLSPIYDYFVQNTFDFLNIPLLFNSNGEYPHLNATLSEQRVGLGILSFLLLLPAFIKTIFKKNNNLKHFCLIFIFQAILLSATIVYFPTTIRFYIAFCTILIPIITIFYKKGWYKNLITIIAVFYLLYTPLFLTQRPFTKIINEFKNSNYETITNKLRDVDYDFYFTTKQHTILKKEIELISDKKIGIFLKESFMAYPIKYYSNKNNSKIDFLTYGNNKNYDYYDYLIYQDNYQTYSTIKNFVEEKNCNFTKFHDKITGKICIITPKNFKNFSPYKLINYKADDFLKQTGNDNDTVFYILKNNVTNY